MQVMPWQKKMTRFALSAGSILRRERVESLGGERDVDGGRDRAFLHARQRARVDEHVAAGLGALGDQRGDLVVLHELLGGDLDRALEPDLGGRLDAVLLHVGELRLVALADVAQGVDGLRLAPVHHLEGLRVEAHDLGRGVDLELDRLRLERDALEGAERLVRRRPCGSWCRTSGCWPWPRGRRAPGPGRRGRAPWRPAGRACATSWRLLAGKWNRGGVSRRRVRGLARRAPDGHHLTPAAVQQPDLYQCALIYPAEWSGGYAARGQKKGQENLPHKAHS